MPPATPPTHSARSSGAWLLATALSLSVGWGIRGNYGHELGAMFPGAIATVAVLLGAGRTDWLARAAPIAFLGALGWGFGGSISYMQVIGYTHSGDLASQVYGFAALWVIGFLWAALGVGGAAVGAAWDDARRSALFRPLAVALGVLTVLHCLEDAIGSAGLAPGAQGRHEGALYWLDSDWLSAAAVLAAMLAYDLADRRGQGLLHLAALALAGGAAGWALQAIARLIGLEESIVQLLVRHQGDLSRHGAEELIANWPAVVLGAGGHAGWVAGAVAGIALHFARRGRFRHGSGLLVALAAGWVAGFLLLPVLLGVRMTPPRGDNWAGILGAWIGAAAWLWRRGDRAVVAASVLGGTVGGLGFAGAAWIKLLLVAPGNAAFVDPASTAAAWAHWQGANWHSVLEQTYGLVNGAGVYAAMRWLARRAPLGPAPPAPAPLEAPARSPPAWTSVLALAFLTLALPYANLGRNVSTWSAPAGSRPPALPATLRAPLLASIEWSAAVWCNLAWAAVAAVGLAAIVRHHRQPLAVIPACPRGRAQLLWLWVIWVFVLGDLARYLPGFAAGRLLTEGAVLGNTLLASALVLLLPAPAAPRGAAREVALRPFVLGALAALLAGTLVFTASVRAVYGDRHAGHSGTNLRFGPEANWRVAPLLRGQGHR